MDDLGTPVLLSTRARQRASGATYLAAAALVGLGAVSPETPVTRPLDVDPLIVGIALAVAAFYLLRSRLATVPSEDLVVEVEVSLGLARSARAGRRSAVGQVVTAITGLSVIVLLDMASGDDGNPVVGVLVLMFAAIGIVELGESSRTARAEARHGLRAADVPGRAPSSQGWFGRVLDLVDPTRHDEQAWVRSAVLVAGRWG